MSGGISRFDILKLSIPPKAKKIKKSSNMNQALMHEKSIMITDLGMDLDTYIIDFLNSGLELFPLSDPILSLIR